MGLTRTSNRLIRANSRVLPRRRIRLAILLVVMLGSLAFAMALGDWASRSEGRYLSTAGTSSESLMLREDGTLAVAPRGAWPAAPVRDPNADVLYDVSIGHDETFLPGLWRTELAVDIDNRTQHSIASDALYAALLEHRVGDGSSINWFSYRHLSYLWRLERGFQPGTTTVRRTEFSWRPALAGYGSWALYGLALLSLIAIFLTSDRLRSRAGRIAMRRCPSCDYPMVTDRTSCPECGEAYPIRPVASSAEPVSSNPTRTDP
ncbi:MAG: hypothetical protein AAFR38_00510 [Planctomycetota bacterium]